MASTTASPVFRTLPATVSRKPSVHKINIGLGTPSASFTTVVLTGADAGQDNNNATLATQLNALIDALTTAGVIETITGSP